jgi:sensor domain CHASE-containing protein
MSKKMKILLITIVLVLIIFSGCAVPVIVKSITGEALEEEALHQEQKIIQRQCD